MIYTHIHTHRHAHTHIDAHTYILENEKFKLYNI